MDHQLLSRAVHSPTSNHDDSSTISSSLPSARNQVSQHEQQHLADVASSGYESHNTSHTSDSPPPGNSSLHPSAQAPFHSHVRTSTASSSDRLASCLFLTIYTCMLIIVQYSPVIWIFHITDAGVAISKCLKNLLK